MSKRKKALRKLDAKEKLYSDILEFVSEEQSKGNAGLVVIGYLSQKAKAENSSGIYGAIAALAINFMWQFIMNFLVSAASANQISEAAQLSLNILCFVLSVVFIFGSVLVVCLLYLSNRDEKEQLLFKERILRKKGLIE